nr:response regulator [Bacteroidales bacterium]
MKIKEKFSEKLILLVDDAPENIEILNGLLQGVRKKVATSGERALELAVMQPKPDLILLDIIMPGLDGF